jgi:hypothetical protein
MADHAQGCYGGSMDKSMKAVEAVSQEGCWRKIAVSPIDPAIEVLSAIA